MRDPKRIPNVMAQVMSVWKRSPDLRLGQLIANLSPMKIYYLEDDELLKRLHEVYPHEE